MPFLDRRQGLRGNRPVGKRMAHFSRVSTACVWLFVFSDQNIRTTSVELWSNAIERIEIVLNYSLMKRSDDKFNCHRTVKNDRNIKKVNAKKISCDEQFRLQHYNLIRPRINFQLPNYDVVKRIRLTRKGGRG